MYPPHRTVHPADSSVLLRVRGVIAPIAVVIAVVFGAVGIILDRTVFAPASGPATIGWGFGLMMCVGIALAALAVRRGSIFTAMIQAPIIVTLEVFLAFRLIAGEGNIFAASKVITAFPTMAIASGIGLLLGIVRIIAQPLRSHQPAAIIEEYDDMPTPETHDYYEAGY